VRFPGRSISGLTLAIAGALWLSALAPAEAARRGKSRFDGIRDCERTANVQFRRHDAAMRRFAIDRAHVTFDKYADRIGPTFVSAVYHGKATYEAAAGPKPVRFVCLHGGMHRRALFVYTLPE
jgi:hypothetical protein